MAGSGVPPPMPPRNYVHTYVYDQLPGHNPNTAWWATPFAVLGFVAAFVLVLMVLLWIAP